MGERQTVLIVDDEPALVDGRAAQLADQYDTRTAYDGEAALEVLDGEDGDVDVVFLDRRMPGRPGEAVLEAIRERGYGCRVVMLTGVEPDADVVEMGFDEYLVKPVEADDLRAVVERLLARSSAGVDVDDGVLDVLGDPKTRHCWYVLAKESHSARGLADATGYSLPTVYRRLNALRQADLIASQIAIDPGGDHYETFAAVPTRIEVEIPGEDPVAVERFETEPA